MCRRHSLQGAVFEIPGLSYTELERMAEFYADYEAIPDRPDNASVVRMSAMTCGNGAEFRRYITVT